MSRLRSRTTRGSPPLARERLDPRTTRWVSARITPARAGKTAEEKVQKLLDRDHPRSRGKDLYIGHQSSRLGGSPPLARERRCHAHPMAFPPGITPARAGKTRPCQSFRAPPGDHPRSRGKDITSAALLSGRRGSPPLARERRLRISERIAWTGITPARAGKTA